MEKARMNSPCMKKRRKGREPEDHTKLRDKKRTKRMKCQQGR